ncbi:unnamed protein product [Nezara viridula]|uniref:C2H2-type domain-containing protein n=1 Tax=Nezara viridula TaxID=85310 RepID=A0A9P0MQD0_NEZVI|nr:unnamed protein product [Nezara viridula]
MDETESTCVNSSAVVKKENTDGIDSSCLNNSAVFIKEENIDETESTSSVTKIKQEPSEIFCCAGLLPLKQEKNELVTVNDICEPAIVIKEEKTDYIEYTDFRNHVKEEEEMIMPDDGDQDSFKFLKEIDQCELKTKWKKKKRTSRGNFRPVSCQKDEEMTYKCQYCEFTANYFSNFKTHIKAHHLKHQCPHCKYAAASPSIMKNHIISCHTDEKPFKCPYCDFTTARESNVKRHVLTLHKELRPHHRCLYKIVAVKWMKTETENQKLK